MCVLFQYNLCSVVVLLSLFFFFQAEDGIRDRDVTGVQTCALPIYAVVGEHFLQFTGFIHFLDDIAATDEFALDVKLEIGRASCRERV